MKSAPKRMISLVTPCYNEEENVLPLYEALKKLMAIYPQYIYEHIYIDNASSDRTVELIKSVCARDPQVKLIANARNFGHIRSPFYGLLQTSGDCAVLMASDFQDPPELLHDFIKFWEAGYRVVIGVKTESEESRWMFMVRKFYYWLIKRFSHVEQIKNFTGYGLYDRQFLDALRRIQDPYPYFRGLISDIGFERCEVPFRQPKRARGKSKNNFYSLYDMAMLGFVNHSKIPLRLSVFTGFILSFFCLLIAVFYLIYKLVFWDSFQVGMAPLVIGIFFLGGVQLSFIGIIGEYIGAIYTQVKNQPLVIEKERLNFD